MRNVAHVKKLNSRSETSGGQAVTPVPVNVVVSEAGTEPTEGVLGEGAKSDPAPPTDGSCHTRHACCAIYATSACSVQTNVDERLREEICFSCFS